MADIVLDASAVLAVLLGEPGAEVVRPHLPAAVISAVNYAEVLSRIYPLGGAPEDAKLRVDRHVRTVLPFDPDQAAVAASLKAVTRSHSLSLGDRACLATALTRGGSILTANRALRDLEVGVVIEVIR